MKRYYIQGRELSFNENRLVFDEQFQPVYQIKGSTFSGSQQIYTMDYQTVANLNHSLFEFKTTILKPHSQMDTLTKNCLVNEQIFLQSDWLQSTISLFKDGQLIGTIQNQSGKRQVDIHNEQYENELLLIALATDYRRLQLLGSLIPLALILWFIIF